MNKKLENHNPDSRETIIIENKGGLENYDFTKLIGKKIDQVIIRNDKYDNISYLDIDTKQNISIFDIKNILIQDTIFTEKSEDTEIGTLTFNGGKNIIDEFKILYNLKINKHGIIDIKNFRINNLIIEDDDFRRNNENGFNLILIKDNKVSEIIFINNIKIDNLRLENINNNFESFEIRNCKIDKLIIRNSNLGKAVFNGVKIGKLEIENATLNDCIFNGVDFCNNYQLSDNNGKIPTKVLKDNYRQLKHVMDKNGNHTEANKFFALEMKYYGKTLNWISKDFINKLIHKFQYYTSRFGNSIIWSITSLLIFINISNGINYGIMNYFYNISIDWKLNFINLLNPFFGFNKGIYEDLKEIKIIYLGFVLYKVVYAILVYQLIIALKRTTKR